MDFDYSPKTKDLQQRLLKFMEENIYPAEKDYAEEMLANTAADWAVAPTLAVGCVALGRTFTRPATRLRDSATLLDWGAHTVDLCQWANGADGGAPTRYDLDPDGNTVEFLQAEGIMCVGQSLGGDRARRVRYWPFTGRAAQILLAPSQGEVFASERKRLSTPAAAPAVTSGELELF